MRNILKNSVWLIFFVLIVTNIFVFVSGIQLSDKINYFDIQTKDLHRSNLELENKLSEIGSLQHAASIAANLDFTQKAQPMYLENLKYAMNH
jgi:hypothetical protein